MLKNLIAIAIAATIGSTAFAQAPSTATVK